MLFLHFHVTFRFGSICSDQEVAQKFYGYTFHFVYTAMSFLETTSLVARG